MHQCWPYLYPAMVSVMLEIWLTAIERPGTVVYQYLSQARFESCLRAWRSLKHNIHQLHHPTIQEMVMVTKLSYRNSEPEKIFYWTNLQINLLPNSSFISILARSIALELKLLSKCSCRLILLILLFGKPINQGSSP